LNSLITIIVAGSQSKCGSRAFTPSPKSLAAFESALRRRSNRNANVSMMMENAGVKDWSGSLCKRGILSTVDNALERF
jgi:hypothetical protein